MPIADALKPVADALRPAETGGGSSSSTPTTLSRMNNVRSITLPETHAKVLVDTLQRSSFAARQSSDLCMKLSKQFHEEASVLDQARSIISQMLSDAGRG